MSCECRFFSISLIQPIISTAINGVIGLTVWLLYKKVTSVLANRSTSSTSNRIELDPTVVDV